MKKVFVLIITLLLAAFAFTGCGSLFNCGNTTATSTIMTEKPWKNNFNYEKVTYDISRYTVKYSEKDGEKTFNTDRTIAEGTYTLTLTTIAGNVKTSEEFAALGENADFGEYFGKNISGVCRLRVSGEAGTEVSVIHAELVKEDGRTETPGAYSVLVADYSLTYNDDEDNGDYKGKTDTISSIVIFRNATLMPVFSYKKADLASSGISYSARADYVNGFNHFEEDGKATADVSIKENYDNELLYYIVRSHTGVSSGTSTSLEVHNSVETGVYGKEAVNNIGVSVDTGSYYVNGIDAEDKTGFVKSYLGDSVEYIDEEKKAEMEAEAAEKGEESEVSVGYSIPARIVALGRNEQNRGPSTTLSYSSVDFTYYGNIMKNVLLTVTNYQFDTDTRLVEYMNMITISDYTIEK